MNTVAGADFQVLDAEVQAQRITLRGTTHLVHPLLAITNPGRVCCQREQVELENPVTTAFSPAI